ncbi:MAG: efflux RND transporter periplasmic adaptor subunit [Acidobacteriota bacterium]|nr:efflux RND transporter periplasmic adaptor subunit [Acidobacteriota bacterium]MDH3524399.1 efflux RND transporter periplasmic adaptor subunit [Acidobacteriota bacterium]
MTRTLAQIEPRRGRRSGTAARLLAAWTGCLLAIACQEPPEPEVVLRPVRYELVSPSEQARLRTFAGVAKAGLESDLSFRVAGTVEQVPVVVGQRVGRGQMLARLDTTDYELKVQEALAGLAQAQAAARNAEADYERVRGLYESNNASRRELDGARANSESSRALVQAAEKRIEQARRQLSYCTLRAPVDGTVASKNVEVNENVQAGQKLFLLTAGAEIEVEVALPEAVISGVELGQPVEVVFDAVPGRRFTAAVTEAGGAAVGTATTFPVTVRLTEPNPGVRSGMAAEVGFRFGGEGDDDRLIVPAVAVGEDRDGRFVYVLEDVRDGRGAVRRTPVTTGELSADGLEILSGLRGGEHVVTAGVRRLTNGERVLVREGA